MDDVVEQHRVGTTRLPTLQEWQALPSPARADVREWFWLYGAVTAAADAESSQRLLNIYLHSAETNPNEKTSGTCTRIAETYRNRVEDSRQKTHQYMQKAKEAQKECEGMQHASLATSNRKRICVQFRESGSCYYGEKCKKLHVTPTEVCEFPAGLCKNWGQCDRKHKKAKFDGLWHLAREHWTLHQ